MFTLRFSVRCDQCVVVVVVVLTCWCITWHLWREMCCCGRAIANQCLSSSLSASSDPAGCGAEIAHYVAVLFFRARVSSDLTMSAATTMHTLTMILCKLCQETGTDMCTVGQQLMSVNLCVSGSASQNKCAQVYQATARQFCDDVPHSSSHLRACTKTHPLKHNTHYCSTKLHIR